MRIAKLIAVVTITLCCFLMAPEVKAQAVWGYATITFDETTNSLTGYASTETDYSTAYYYDAEVQAEIKDENDNIIASGSDVANTIASTSINVFEFLHCVSYTIVAYVLLRPSYWGCDGGAYYDYWGFGRYSWGSYWDYGYFSSYSDFRCEYGYAIFIATVIARVLQCLPTEISCGPSSFEALPTGFRQGFEFPFVTGTDKLDFVCTARQVGTSIPQSRVRINFGFDPVIIDYGGHEGHTGQRPRGTYSRTAVTTTVVSNLLCK